MSFSGLPSSGMTIDGRVCWDSSVGNEPREDCKYGGISARSMVELSTVIQLTGEPSRASLGRCLAGPPEIEIEENI